MDGIPISAIVWFIGLMFLNAFIEAIVTALDSVNEVNLEKKIEEGSTKAKLVMLVLGKRHPRYITVLDFIRIATIGSLSVIYVTYFWKQIGLFLRQHITDQNLIAFIIRNCTNLIVTQAKFSAFLNAIFLGILKENNSTNIKTTIKTIIFKIKAIKFWSITCCLKNTPISFQK